MDELSDAILIARAREDSKNFKDLYERYCGKLFRYFAVRTGDKQTAEDLTSETFLKVVEKFDSYNFEGKPFGAWLFRIGHNLMVDHFRKHKETKPIEDAYDLSSNEDIKEQTHFKLISEEIDKLLMRFSEDEREILLLKLTSGLKFSEIAKLLGQNENSIKSTYFRNLKILKNQADKLAILILLLFQ